MAYPWVTVMQVFAITGSRPSPRENDGKVVKMVYMYINYMNDLKKILLSQTIGYMWMYADFHKTYHNISLVQGNLIICK